MKIHDKFVIELAEVIKGYSNDYREYDPFHLPCDYKFYEISGVAICEESFSKMKPLGVEIDAVLDKIRAEIHANAEMHEDGDYYLRDEWIDEIFDKYKAESEDKK